MDDPLCFAAVVTRRYEGISVQRVGNPNVHIERSLFSDFNLAKLSFESMGMIANFDFFAYIARFSSDQGKISIYFHDKGNIFLINSLVRIFPIYPPQRGNSSTVTKYIPHLNSLRKSSSSLAINLKCLIV